MLSERRPLSSVIMWGDLEIFCGVNVAVLVTDR